MATKTETRVVEIIVNGQKANASIKEMEAGLYIMNNQLRKMGKDDPGRAKLLKDYRELRLRTKEAKDELYGVEKASLAAKLGLTGMGSIWKAAIGTAAGMLTAGGIQGALSSIAGFFTKASSTAKDFEHALSNLSSVTGATGEDLKFFKDQAAEIGRTTTLSASQAVEAFKLIGSAKPELLKNKEALASVTKEAIALAEAAEIDLPSAAKAMAGALNQFQLPAEEASRVINALAAGSKEGSAEIPELQASIDKFGVAASSFNVTFEESVALVETLGEFSMKGAEAGTALRNVLSKMASVKALPKEAIAELERFGVNLNVVSDSTIPLNQRLAEFSKISGDATALTKVFGIENKNAGEIILTNVDKFKDLTAAVTGTNVAYEQAATNTDDLEGDTKALSSVMEALYIKVGERLNVGLREGVQAATGLVNWFVELVTKADPLIAVFEEVWQELSSMYTQIEEVVEGLGLLSSEGSFAEKVISGLAFAFKVILTPIKLAAIAIGGLVEGFTYLYNNFELVRGSVGGFSAAIKGSFTSILNSAMNILGGVGDIITGIFRLDLDKIKSGFAKGFEALKDVNPVALAATMAKDFSRGYQENLDTRIPNKMIKKATDEAVEAGDKIGAAAGNATSEAFKAGLASFSLNELNQKLDIETDKTHQAILKKEIAHRKSLDQEREKGHKVREKEEEKVKKAQEKFQESSHKADLEFQKLKVEVMQEGIDKVLAKLKVQHDQELYEIEQHRAKVVADVAATEEEKAAMLELYRQQKELKEQQYQEQERQAKLDADAKEREEVFTELEADEAYRQEVLTQQFGLALDAEHQREMAMLDLKKEILAQKIALLQAAGLGETTQALRLKNELVKVNKQQNDEILANEERTRKAKHEILSLGLASAKEAMELGISFLKEDTKARKAAGAALKAFSIGKVLIDVKEEIAAIWKTANANPANILFPGSGTIIAGLKTGFAVARSAKAIRDIAAQQFYGGGMTAGRKAGGHTARIRMHEMDGVWQMLSGQSGGSQPGSFSPGGWVNNAQLGLIGEKGRELVLPNWMVESPRYADLTGYLAAEIQRKGTAYASGGYTPGARNSQAPAMPAKADESVSCLQEISEKLDAFREEITVWQRELKVVLPMTDFEREHDRYKKVKSESSIS